MLSSLGDFLPSIPILAEIPIAAPGLVGWLTSSIFVALIVLGVVYFLVRAGTKRITAIPSGMQNAVEFMVEFLYDQVEGVVGKHIAPKAFPLLATIFVYVLVANWFGLLPGVGTIGMAGSDDHGVTHKMAFFGLDGEPRPPLFRPATADVNLTLGMAACFMVVWLVITIKEVGVWGFFVHTFGPKGGLQGIMKIILLPIFFFVGIIEIISILFRPVSLSLRLFGNIFAGENLLHAMSSMGELLGLGTVLSFISSIVLPLPFYFMELLVGVLQATVFSLLCAVYIQLSTAHDEEEAH